MSVNDSLLNGILIHYHFFPFQLIKNTPIRTKTVPMICSSQMFSPKNAVARKIVKIGPILAIIEALPEPTCFIPSDNINVGKTVEKTAIDIEII